MTDTRFAFAAEGRWRIDADAESTIFCRRRHLLGGGERARLDVWPRDPDADMCARTASGRARLTAWTIRFLSSQVGVRAKRAPIAP